MKIGDRAICPINSAVLGGTLLDRVAVFGECLGNGCHRQQYSQFSRVLEGQVQSIEGNR